MVINCILSTPGNAVETLILDVKVAKIYSLGRKHKSRSVIYYCSMEVNIVDAHEVESIFVPGQSTLSQLKNIPNEPPGRSCLEIGFFE